jgi:solute carrier family 25 (mitochondrial S-adenosylmethionine transporter), member 26
VYPLDTLKTRQQSQDFLKTFASPSQKTKLPSPQLFRGLYQGIGIVIVATLPAAGTFFTVYEAAKSVFSSQGKRFGLPQPLVYSAASAVAEMSSCLVLTPAEVIKQNAQMVETGSSAKHSGSRTSTSMLALRQLGAGGLGSTMRKLSSGYTAMVARNLPFTALQFPIFEYVRNHAWDRRRRADQGGRRSLWETGLVTGTSAGFAGSIAAVVTTPMDVVKTRMMLSGGEGEAEGGGDAKKQRSSGYAVARRVYAEKGLPGLFRGAILRAVWTAVGSGLYLGMYEVSKVWLTRDKGGDSDDDGFL